MRQYEREEDDSVKLRAAELKVERQAARIMQLEEQAHAKEEHYLEELKRLRLENSSARDLCTKILAKDRREMQLDNNYAWGKLTTDELIRKTAASFDEYAKGRTTALQRLHDKYVQALEEAEDMRQELEDARKHAGKSSVPANLQTKEAIEEIIQRDNEQLKIAYCGGELFEDDDETEDESRLIKKCTDMAASAITSEQRDKKFKQSVRSTTRQKRPDSKTNQLHAQIDRPSEEIRSLYNVIKDDKGIVNIITCIGKYGYSLPSQVRDALDIQGRQYQEPVKKMISGDIRLLEIAEGISFPGTPSTKVLFLSLEGKMIYKLLTDDYPVESEAEKLKRFHATLEHGYGIKQCYLLFSGTHKFTELDMYSKDFPLGSGGSYCPDILGKYIDENGEEQFEFYEYERGNQSNMEYYSKFNKIALSSQYINMIVPTTTDQTEMQEIMYEWAQAKKDNPLFADITMRLVAYSTLKQRIESGMSYENWWRINKHIRDFPPANAMPET